VGPFHHKVRVRSELTSRTIIRLSKWPERPQPVQVL
jgi:hypothetical protein